MATKVDIAEASLMHVNSESFQNYPEQGNSTEVTPVMFIGRLAPQHLIIVSPLLTTLERIALGCYFWKNPHISNDLLPYDPTAEGIWEYDVYSISNCTSAIDVMCGAQVDGWIVAKAEHLLALGEQFPNLQCDGAIIALGSVCGVIGRRRVLGIWCNEGERCVGLVCWVDYWRSLDHFLRVRKISQLVA